MACSDFVQQSDRHNVTKLWELPGHQIADQSDRIPRESTSTLKRSLESLTVIVDSSVRLDSIGKHECYSSINHAVSVSGYGPSCIGMMLLYMRDIDTITTITLCPAVNRSRLFVTLIRFIAGQATLSTMQIPR